MKKFVSILLTLAMVATMIPVIAVGTFADTTNNTATTTTGKWTDEGNYSTEWYGDGSATAFYIDTAADLAGVAVKVNTDGVKFEGKTIYITADIDLAGKTWVPIATKNVGFKANIIGSKGAADSTNTGNGGQITIKNMTVNTKWEAKRAVASGLVGFFEGTVMSNMALVNASVTAESYGTAGFVGRVGKSGTYSNLSSDAKVALIGVNGAKKDGEGEGWDGAGGIVGVCDATSTFENCTFTGSVDGKIASAAGGIVGAAPAGAALTFNNCIVNAGTIANGANTADTWFGVGGIAGCARGVNVFNNCYVKADISTCRNGANLGGIIGSSWNTVTMTDCQFNGTVDGSGRRSGAFMGYIDGGKAPTYTNCVNTGIAVNIKDCPNMDGNTIIACGSGNTLSVVTNVFSVYTMRIAYGQATMIPVIDANTATTLTTAAADKWAAVNGKPVLKIAQSLVGTDYCTTELAWLDLTAEEMVITTEAQLDGVAAIIDMAKGSEEKFVKKLDIADALLNADLSGYSETAQKYIAEAMGIVTDATYDANKISVQFAQIALEANVNEEKPQFNGTYNIRIVAKVGDATMKNAYFEYSLTQDDTTKEAESAKITTCYKELIEVVNGEEKTISAGDGYFVVLLITNVSFADVQNNSLSIRAYATGADDAVYYSGSFTNITLEVPTASAAN